MITKYRAKRMARKPWCPYHFGDSKWYRGRSFMWTAREKAEYRKWVNGFMKGVH